jgi:hypothetical protein
LQTNTVDIQKKEEIEVQIHKEYKERKRVGYKYSRRMSQKEMKKMSSDHKSRGRGGKGNEKINNVELGLETSLNSKKGIKSNV